MTGKGNLYLIPNTLGGQNPCDVFPDSLSERIKHIRIFAVEKLKPARQLLASIGLREIIDESVFVTLHKGADQDSRELLSNGFKVGKDIGLISDAGCPGIADPGNDIVKMAHALGSRVVPLTGPSSIILALMASGFNGQNFAFHGYLPKDQVERKNKIRELDQTVHQKDQTQLFIETPYRNQHVFEDLLSECQKNTVICLAKNLTMPDESVEVHNVETWKKIKPDLNKKQCIFLIYH